MALIEEEYRRRHESFVSNLEGSSLVYLLSLLAVFALLLLFVKLLNLRYELSLYSEFAMLFTAVILLLTILADFAPLIALVLLLMCSSILASHRKSAATYPTVDSAALASRHQAFITDFKGFVVCLTVVSILAVDFSIFPRYLAKTETWGVSLMDLGTGAYLVSSAVTSRTARGLEGGGRSYRGSSMGMLLLLLLGVGRPLALAALNYPQHRSEYGRHWSFFLTLLGVWAIALVVHRVVRSGIVVAILSAGGVACYQLALSQSGLSGYVLGAAHGSSQSNYSMSAAVPPSILSPAAAAANLLSGASLLLDENREGVWSLAGYAPLFLLAEQLARLALHPPFAPAPRSSDSVPAGLSEGGAAAARRRLPAMALALWLLFGASNSLVQLPSRRLCNLTYVLFVLACTVSLLTALRAADQLLWPAAPATARPLRSLALLSKHALAVFLLGNVLTGLVNLLAAPLDRSAAAALALLLGYAALLVGGVVALGS
eukprot:gene38875-47287_t